jgi:hypothetical protein
VDKTLSALKSLAVKAETEDERNTLEWAMTAYGEAVKRREREALAANAEKVTRERRIKEEAARRERERKEKEKEERRINDLMDKFPVTYDMIKAAIACAEAKDIYGGIEHEWDDGHGTSLTAEQASELYWAMRLAEKTRTTV